MAALSSQPEREALLDLIFPVKHGMKCSHTEAMFPPNQNNQLNKKILEITLPKFLTHKNRNKSCSMPQTVKMVYT